MGGVPLENIICLNNGIRHYDHKILTKTIVALGELWKIKFNITREYTIMTMEFSPRLISRMEGALWKIKYDLNRKYAIVTMKFTPKLFSHVEATFKMKFDLTSQ